MSGHSKWAKTHRQKEATDAKRGAIFTKLANVITLAAKEGGDDPESNFKLRLAIEKAKSSNMPKDNIEKAVKRGSGKNNEGAILEETTYEVFGPANSVFIVEAITDNKNRTLSDIKIALNKNGGQMGSPNSVSWMFERKGLIIIDQSELTGKDLEQLELDIIDAGAEDIIKDQDWEIRTLADQLQKTENDLKKLNLKIKESNLAYIAKDELNISEPEQQERIEKLFNALDDCDDVNNIYLNIA